MVLPSQQLLEKVSQQINNIPNKRGEYKRKIHYGCYLLGYKSGLRISEAIKLDLSSKNKQGLYRIEKPKGQKERYVYIPKEVIRELKNNNWQPNQTNRWAFYHFLQKIKRELNISPNIELTPHTLRRAFTTYHAEAGMPLPLLQKLLGHRSIRTTALYWQNIHGNNNDTIDILAGKKWLEDKEKRPPAPITENFPRKSPEISIITKKPVITEPKPIIKEIPPPISREPKLAIDYYQPKTPNGEISLKKERKFFRSGKISFEKENFSLNDKPTAISKKMPLITNNPTENTEKEKFLLAKIKQLEGQLKQKHEETKLLEAQNIILKTEKVKAEAIAEQEKQRADHYQQQLKTIAKAFQQWQKINYYQQLEKEQEIQAQIIQLPPFKGNK